MRFVIGLSEICAGVALLLAGVYMMKNLPRIAAFVKNSGITSLNPASKAVIIAFGVLLMIAGAGRLFAAYHALIAVLHTA